MRAAYHSTSGGIDVLRYGVVDDPRPLHPDEVASKFRDNASRALPAGRVHALERAALALDTLDDVRRLTELCRP